MPNGFPTNQDIARIKQLEEYKKLFDGLHDQVFDIKDLFQKDLEKQKLLYAIVDLPALISEYFADLIIGTGVLFDVEDKEIQNKTNEIAKANDFDVLLYESGLSQSEYGFVPIRLRNDNGKAVIEQIPASQFFPVWSNDIKPVIESFVLAAYIEMGTSDMPDIYLYKEVYSKDGDRVVIERQLWTVDSEGKQDKQVTLSKYDESLSESENTGFNVYPIWQINNLKTAEDLFGRSDYYNVKSQLEIINEALTQIRIELRKNLYSRIAVPQGTIDKNGKIKVSEADIFEVGIGDKMPAYIQKDNPLIEEAFNEINFHLRMISAITKIPVESLGLEGKGGVEKVEAMRLRLFNTEKKVQRKRVYFTKALEEMMSMALAIEGVKDASVNIVWDDILPVSEIEQTDILERQVGAKLKSQRKAVKELQNLDDELLDKEMQDIEGDNTVKLDSITEPKRPLMTFEQINEI
jgi:hypothetical protein